MKVYAKECVCVCVRVCEGKREGKRERGSVCVRCFTLCPAVDNVMWCNLM